MKIPTSSFAYFDANRQMILDSAQRRSEFQPILATNNNGANDESGVVIIGDNAGYASENQNDEKVEPAKLEEEVKKIRKVKKRYYVVKRGDVLNKVADKFDVDMYDIRVWNKLKSSKIMVGQRLVILDDGGEDIAADKTIKNENRLRREIEKNKPKFHIVQRGDTLWSIAQRYGGISIEKLKKMNGLRTNSVKKGQKLKITG